MWQIKVCTGKDQRAPPVTGFRKTAGVDGADIGLCQYGRGFGGLDGVGGGVGIYKGATLVHLAPPWPDFWGSPQNFHIASDPVDDSVSDSVTSLVGIF